MAKGQKKFYLKIFKCGLNEVLLKLSEINPCILAHVYIKDK